MRNTIIMSLLTLLGLATACGQHFDNVDVNCFAELIADPDVVLLDVRTAAEYDEGHIANALTR